MGAGREDGPAAVLLDAGRAGRGRVWPMSDGSESAAGAHESMGWREHLQRMRRNFPSPWRDERADDAFEDTFLRTVKWLDQMKPPRHFEGQAAWKGYLGTPALPDYSRCHDARLSEEMTPLDDVLRGLVGLFDGMPNWNHPQTMANVIPPANTASILALFDELRDGGLTLVIITHDRDVAARATRQVAMRDGRFYEPQGVGRAPR